MGRAWKALAIVLAGSTAGCSTAREPLAESRSTGVSDAHGEAAPAAPGAPAPPSPAGADPSAAAGAAAPRAAPAPPDAVPPTPAGDRIYAKARFVWIQQAPRASRGWIGYLTLGGSVRLHNGSADEAKVIGPGCDAWYRVEPFGYVCLGAETTLDPHDPEFVALRAHAAKTTSPFPYEYGESVGTPRYDAIPSEAEQRRREWDLDAHRGKLTALGIDAAPAGKGPPDLPRFSPLVREARSSVARGSTVAWTDSFDAEGRTWLYTSDHAFVPKDRVKPYPRSEFEGVRLDERVTLPIAFFRKKDRPKYKRDASGFHASAETFPRLGSVGLTGEEVKAGGQVYLETKEAGVWVLASDAAVATRRTVVPYRSDEAAGRRTWLDISVLTGTLVAYEGETPVFATLISPGRGGLPVPGHDPISTASTPIGTFRVDGKFRTATMVSSTDSSIVHAEVQFVQNFSGPHALHGAYWHDAWGELKSGGCVNLSPRDSKWIFAWTEPRLPEEWHGVRSIPDLGTPTRVTIRP